MDRDLNGIGGRRLCLRVAFALAFLALPVALLTPQSEAATTERIISDRLTGVALYGFDSVAYFVDGEAREGAPGFELAHAGLVWRFRNEGNRAAFAAHPDDFMPRFGGYDPLGIARGVAASGYPTVFAVYENKLVLFMSEENRAAFLASPTETLAAADAAWAKVAEKLVP